VKRPSDAEALIAPELALLPPLLALLDATLILLRAAHPTLELGRSPDEPPRLRAARTAAAQLHQASLALRRYARAARRGVRQAVLDAEIPF
jgi:hypothetical protein